MQTVWTYITKVSIKKGLNLSLGYYILISLLSSIHIMIFKLSFSLIPLFWILKTISIYISTLKLKHLDITDENFKVDRQIRGQIIMLISIIFILVEITIGLNFNIFYHFWNSIHGISLLSFSFCLFLIGLSIYRNNFYIRFLGIISTTFLGFFGLIFLILSVLTLVITLFSFSTNNNAYNHLIKFISTFKNENLIIVSYILNEKYIFVFIIITIYSVIFLLIIIIFHPPYQLDQLSNVLKLSNIIISLVSISIFFHVSINFSGPSLLEQKQVALKLAEKEKINFNEINIYIKNFSKANLINLATILFTPYIVALLVTNFFLDLKKNLAKKKSSKILSECIHLGICYKNEDIQSKKYFFYAGDKNAWLLYNTLSKKIKSKGEL
ncbi:hypothetical protein NSS78_02375 [Bacillus sp. FSL W8-0920]|uniref:hypothetical protein n=1 Tax=Bacillus TaxID=1386 RepID=UPI001B8226B6|nr:hypothetical protein [Bacillus pumilus]MBR0591618.1 hypothetical protein [Bacillus pumilus sxm20-2]MCY7436738.1 hypothetical protein [Bacillus pumilus]MDR0120656.1 hypothetical protein [Bacillus pumilus]MED1529023.1 hypothetical protein [Bacillus pumilus]